MMLFRLTPPKGDFGAIWINTDHIVSVEEIRSGRPADDEPLALRLHLVTGNPIYIDVGRYGRGAAERVHEWLKQQEKMPVVETPKPLVERVKGKTHEPAVA